MCQVLYMGTSGVVTEPHREVMEMLQVLWRNFTCSGPEVLTLELSSVERSWYSKVPMVKLKRGAAKTPDLEKSCNSNNKLEKSCNSNNKLDREMEQFPKLPWKGGLVVVAILCYSGKKNILPVSGLSFSTSQSCPKPLLIQYPQCTHVSVSWCPFWDIWYMDNTGIPTSHWRSVWAVLLVWMQEKKIYKYHIPDTESKARGHIKQ